MRYQALKHWLGICDSWNCGICDCKQRYTEFGRLFCQRGHAWRKPLTAIRDWCCRKLGHEYKEVTLTLENGVEVLGGQTYYFCIACDDLVEGGKLCQEMKYHNPSIVKEIKTKLKGVKSETN